MVQPGRRGSIAKPTWVAGLMVVLGVAGCSPLALVPGGHCVASEAQKEACRAVGASCRLTHPPDENPCLDIGARCTEAYLARQLDARRLPCMCTCSAEYKSNIERLRQQDPTSRSNDLLGPVP